MKILVIDPSPDANKMLSIALERGGHSVIGVMNPDAVMATLQNQVPSFDGVTISLNLPTIGVGYHFLEKIRKGYPKMLIVVISGYGEEEVRGRCKELGADGYFIKGTPNIPQDLNALIAGWDTSS